MKTFSQLRVCLSRVPGMAAVLFALGALAGLREALLSAQLESSLGLWAFGCAIAACLWVERSGPPPHPPWRQDKAVGWGLLALAFVLGLLGVSDFSYWAGAVGAVVFFGGLVFLPHALGAFFMWLVLVPHAEYLHFLVSYPMRLIGAQCSGAILWACGFDVRASGAELLIAGEPVAITPACSGVDQLEGLLLFAFVAALMMHRRWGWRWAHFLTVLPLILLFNTLRLVVTFAGAECFGDVFLSDTAHTAMGFATVACVCLSFLSIGLLFPKKTEAKP